MGKIPEKIDSKYRYVLLASVRAEQMVNGARSKAEIESAKSTRLAMHEISTDLIDWDYGPAVVPEAELAVEEIEAEPAAEAEA